MDRIDTLTNMLKATPGDSFLQHALSLEYIKAGNDNEARKLFEALLAADPAYVGSYYHLGKLLERAGDYQQAIAVYNEGMQRAKQAGDKHSFSELQGALDEITE